jgi:actin-related protein
MAGLEARLAAELRRLAPAGVDVAVYTPRAPALAAWRGGAALAADGGRMQRAAVTKQRGREEGARTRRRRGEDAAQVRV